MGLWNLPGTFILIGSKNSPKATSGVVQSVLLGVEESPTRVVTGVVLPEGLHLDTKADVWGSGNSNFCWFRYYIHNSSHEQYIAHIHMWIFLVLLLEVEGVYTTSRWWFFFSHPFQEKMRGGRPIGFFIFRKLRLTKMSPRITSSTITYSSLLYIFMSFFLGTGEGM